MKSIIGLHFTLSIVNLAPQSNLRKKIMDKQQGFSLIEVLISLFLVSSMVFALLEQQQQNKQLFNTICTQMTTVNAQDKAYEQRLVERVG